MKTATYIAGLLILSVMLSLPVHSQLSVPPVYPATNCPDSGGNHTNWTLSTQAWSCGTSGGAGGGANTALSNLAAVAINTALLTGASGIDAGSTAAPFRNVYFYGSGTYSSTYYKLAGTPTSTRTVTFPDASDTIAELGQAQTFTANDTFSGVTKLAGTTGTCVTAADGSTVTFDLSQGNCQQVTIAAGTRTFAVSNDAAGKTFSIYYTNGFGGSLAITWMANTKWPGGSAPTPTTINGNVDIVTCTEYSSAHFYCSLAGQNFQ